MAKRSGLDGPNPRRELVTLRQYVRSGSYKEAAWELGISESTARQRVSQLIRRLGVKNATQAAWALRMDPEMAERFGPGNR